MNANDYAEKARSVFEELTTELNAVYEAEGGVRPRPRTEQAMRISMLVAGAAMRLSSEMPDFASAPEDAARAVASMVEGVVAKVYWRKEVREDAFDAADLWRQL